MGVKVRFHKGAWWIFIDHRGRRRAKKIGDKETALEVARKIRQRMAEGDLSVLQTNTGPTLREYAEKWLADGAAARKASTQRFYAFNLSLHILPVLGATPVPALKRADCRDLLVACREKSLKPASMRGVNRTLSVVLSQAVEDALLPANPAFRMGKHLRAGDELPAEIQPLTRVEAHALLEKAETLFPAYWPLFLCALRTGMRLGELIALQWGDIDFSARLIHVRRNRVSGKLTSTKNKQWRRVDMSRALTQALRQLRAGRKKAALKAGKPGPPWVFLTPDGHPVDGDNLRNRVFYRLLEKAELRQIRFHDLRHTYASLLIQQGESLAYVQQQLGHSSIQVTVDIYGHLIPGANRAAVDRLDAQPTRNPGSTEGAEANAAKGGK
jgi:integrase